MIWISYRSTEEPLLWTCPINFDVVIEEKEDMQVFLKTLTMSKQKLHEP